MKLTSTRTVWVLAFLFAFFFNPLYFWHAWNSGRQGGRRSAGTVSQEVINSTFLGSSPAYAHSEQGNTPPPLESNKDCLVYCIEQYEQDILDGVPHAKAFEWYLRCWRMNCANPPMGFETWRGPGGGTVYIIWVDEHSEQGHTVQDEPVSAADPIDWREKWRRPRWVLPFPWLWRRGPFGWSSFDATA